MDKVEVGFKVVKGTGEAIQEMVGNAEKMNGLLRVIAASASEQSAGVSQVCSAVAELDRMTQQNAALVEETAGAASTLKSQATGLDWEVDRFQLPY